MALKIGDLVIRSRSPSGFSRNAIIGLVVGEIDWHLDDDHRGRKQKRYEVLFPDDLEARFWNEEELVAVLSDEAQ